jgi:hypothetical protein
MPRPLLHITFAPATLRAQDFDHPQTDYKSKRWGLTVQWDTCCSEPCADFFSRSREEYDTIEEVRAECDEARIGLVFTEWRKHDEEFNPYEFLQSQVLYFLEWMATEKCSNTAMAHIPTDYQAYGGDPDAYPIVEAYNRKFGLVKLGEPLSLRTLQIYHKAAYFTYSHFKFMSYLFQGLPAVLADEDELQSFLDGAWEPFIDVLPV